MPVTFCEVAACFSEAEWTLLHEQQKLLYRNVIKQIHQTLIQLGYRIQNPETLLRVIQWKDASYGDPKNRIRGLDVHDLGSDNRPAAFSPTPDIFLRIKHEEDPSYKDLEDSDLTEISTDLCAGLPATVPGLSLGIKEEKDLRPMAAGIRGAVSCDKGIVKLEAIAPSEEDVTSVVIGESSEEREAIEDSDVENGDKNEELQINPRKWNIQGEEKYPTEEGQSQSSEQVMDCTTQSRTPCTCTECGKSFTDLASFRRHQFCHIKPHKCTNCEKRFTHQSQLTKHMMIHTEGRAFFCSVCEKYFSNQPSLLTHKRSHTGERCFKCTVCDKMFTRSSQLFTHQRIHTGEKPYACKECKKCFRHISTLSKHQMVHTGERPYRCTQCTKSFSYASALTSHQMTHTGEKPYQCTECEKSFSLRSSLYIHRRIHTGEKPYECSQCKKRFSGASALKKHWTVHTGDKPYECTECGKSFNRGSSLKRHQISHAGDRPYQCTGCDKSFSLRSNLYTHQKIHRGEKPYECTECKKTFRQSSDLRRHHMIHLREKSLLNKESLTTGDA